MEYNVIEVSVVEMLAEKAEIKELNDLELALIGGGIGDPIAA